MTYALRSVVAATAIVLAACSSSNEHPGPPAPMRDAGLPDATVIDATVTDATSPDGPLPPDGAPQPLPPVCDPAATWKPGTLISLSTPDFDRFGSVTPDELSIAWMVPSAGASDGGAPDAAIDAGTDGGGVALPTGIIHYADRALATDVFGATQTVPASVGTFAFDRVALSADGLRLIVVRSDGLGFGETARASRGAAFGAVSEAAFALVNVNRRETIPPDTYQGDPVLSFDGKRMYFSEYGGAITDAVRVTERADPTAIFATEGQVLATDLQTVAGKRRRPSGISSDLRTLFFWDEVAGKERAAWRDSATSPFGQFVDLGPQMFAQPSAACKRLYYSAQGATSVDLFFADAN